jgi:NhaA family Na+:H+ antiporter
VPVAGLGLDLRHWVNDGLMALFFFLVGLEIKRELVVGELRDVRAAALPVIAAAGGVLVPILLYRSLAGGGPAAAGWAIPAATDVAFAVGVLALLGPRVPAGWKLFLLSVAIVDDIIAVTLIAVFYAQGVNVVWLAGAAVGLLLVLALRRAGVVAVWPYVPIAVAVWYAAYRSGIHPTIAAVALALLTPARPVGGREVLARLQHRLHPVVAFAVVPAFALANAGVDLTGATSGITGAVVWATGIGLFAGKTLGIGGFTLIALAGRLGRLPADMRVREVWGIACVAGIGFTVSLFISDLAFDEAALATQAKLGIFAGSLASGVVGALMLRVMLRHRDMASDVPTLPVAHPGDHHMVRRSDTVRTEPFQDATVPPARA